MGTNIEGNGPDAFGLAKGGGSGMIGGSGTGKGGKGSKFGGYASKVQGSVVQALRNHKKTKSATLNVTARVWLDATGRVTRATITGSSGDPATDAALRNEILTGLQMQAPPPEGMPMPIVMRLKATRPN
jgi:TonB family protein